MFDKPALAVEDLDEVIPVIRHENLATSVQGHAPRVVEKTASGTRGTPLSLVITLSIENFDPVIVGTGNIDLVGLAIDRDPSRNLKLPGPAALASPLADIVALAIEHFYPVIAAVGHIDQPITSHRHTPGVIQLTDSTA